MGRSCSLSSAALWSHIASLAIDSRLEVIAMPAWTDGGGTSCVQRRLDGGFPSGWLPMRLGTTAGNDDGGVEDLAECLSKILQRFIQTYPTALGQVVHAVATLEV